MVYGSKLQEGGHPHVNPPAAMTPRQDYRIRLATPEDETALRALIPRSARALSDGFYSPEQAEAAITHIFGLDTTLVHDRTYFVAETVAGDTSAPGIAGCGGWSRRHTLYGGDQRKSADDPLLDPARDAARIRAFFVSPEHARRGIGAMLMDACVQAAASAGFTRLELMATLPGVPLYAAHGFREMEHVVERLPGGVDVTFIRMHRTL